MLLIYRSFLPKPLIYLAFPILALLNLVPAHSQTQPLGIIWQNGPMTASLGGVATIEIPEGYKFADAAGTKRFMELNQNPTSGQEVGLIMPAKDPGKNQDWFMLFEFHETGYISDSEKGSINNDAVLESIKRGTEAANEIRKKNNWTEFHVVGWSREPYYDDRTHNLTWAILGEENSTGKGRTINHSVRLLGRRGTMSVDLVLAPEQLAIVLPEFDRLMKQFSYTNGNRYSEFVKGDKVASYGLTALIAGGAAAAAVKTGLFAKLLKLLTVAVAALWKFIVIMFAAIFSQIKKVINWMRGLVGKKKKNNIESTDSDPLLLTKGSDIDKE